jgi:uncharacterized membrane protein
MIHPQIHKGKPRSSVTRSLIKTVIYRFISWGSTCILAWIFIGAKVSNGSVDAGDIAQSVAVFGTVDMVANTVLYFLYERAWAHIDLHAEKKEAENAGV